MLSLPQQTIKKIKKYLLRQQKEVKERLQTIEADDPVLIQDIVESPESGTESWKSEVHGRLTTLKNDLSDLSKKITDSLLRLKRGTYGKCESCGKQIEEERLEAIPTATFCVSCSKNNSKKR